MVDSAYCHASCPWKNSFPEFHRTGKVFLECNGLNQREQNLALKWEAKFVRKNPNPQIPQMMKQKQRLKASSFPAQYRNRWNLEKSGMLITEFYLISVLGLVIKTKFQAGSKTPAKWCRKRKPSESTRVITAKESLVFSSWTEKLNSNLEESKGRSSHFSSCILSLEGCCKENKNQSVIQFCGQASHRLIDCKGKKGAQDSMEKYVQAKQPDLWLASIFLYCCAITQSTWGGV